MTIVSGHNTMPCSELTLLVLTSDYAVLLAEEFGFNPIVDDEAAFDILPPWVNPASRHMYLMNWLQNAPSESLNASFSPPGCYYHGPC